MIKSTNANANEELTDIPKIAYKGILLVGERLINQFFSSMKLINPDSIIRHPKEY